MPTNCVIYTRFSPKKRGSDEHNSCDVQQAYCEQYAAKRNWGITGIYRDERASGKDEDRPGMWAAINKLQRFDTLLVWRIDRLARNVYLMELVKRAVRTAGAKIEAVEGDVGGTSAESELIRQVLASIAEYERKIIALRTKWAMMHHQRNGKRMSLHPPYGYRLDRLDPSLLEPVDEEQAVISRVIQLQDDEGLTRKEITRQLKKEGVKGRLGHLPLTTKQVGRILTFMGRSTE